MPQIEIAPGLAIPDQELRYVASRSGGPGGQNVNKVNSRITLLFDVAASPTLDAAQKEKISARLRSRINRDGILQVSSQRHRDQGMNRAAALERFIELLRDAVTDAPPRRKTRTPRAAKRRRIEEKKKRGMLKALRGRKLE
ncbi:MAG TPA: alternative ribosome rescue aminoacyl-tRNA hydrolase ArfB [Thermoanaerobaculia bacterium]|nr:alternative ribosome rescue aminoacyl-tRNA hydrolase ArfB [Thermoanaerobaculia bacterium]